jgi:hypothetical protein
LIRDLEFDQSVRPYDYGFEIAYGLENEMEPLDPSIGFYKATHVDLVRTNRTYPDGRYIRDKIETPISLEKCEDKYFKSFHKSDLINKNVVNSQCFKNYPEYMI